MTNNKSSIPNYTVDSFFDIISAKEAVKIVVNSQLKKIEKEINDASEMGLSHTFCVLSTIL